jgi:DNA helicase HerA-like ATPase
VQHALRAFTPKDQKAVKAAAQTLRPNPAFSAEQAITELEVGEALVSFLDDKGRPRPVERALVVPPASRIGPITREERAALIKGSPLFGHYEQAVDRESAYEKLKGPAASPGTTPAGTGPAGAEAGGGGVGGALGEILMGSTGPRGAHHPGLVEALAKSMVRTVGSQIGRELVRGVLGGLLGGGGRKTRR